MAILLLSGIPLPIAAAAPLAPVTFSASTPTFTGAPSAFLSGPTAVTPTFGAPGSGGTTAGGTPESDPPPMAMPYHNPKVNTAGDPPLSSAVPPTVNCNGDGFFGSSGCDTISPRPDGARTNPFALNALASSPFTVEPPDQGLCAGNGYVMEVLNQGELQVYSSGLNPVSGVVPLDSLMGLTTAGWSSGGDPMCVYDYGNGGHWFITEIVSTNTETSGGPFAGCFAGALNGCLEGIAVSATDNPMGAYNVYFLNPNAVNTDPGAGYLLNDYAKTATTRDAFMVFYDEFNLNPSTYPACPAFGCVGFNGAQQFAFSKSAMELGLPVTDPSFNVAYENMGNAPSLYPIPADGSFQPAAYDCTIGVCWYQVIPAQTPDPSQYDNNHGGTGFMVASLDFLGAGDNRVAAFDWAGLSNLNSPSCSTCGGISFGGQLLTGQATYMDEGGSCPASLGGNCGLAAQETGPIPLGDNCALLGFGLTSPCTENGIATNGDGVTQVSYAQGELWTAVSTLVNQTFRGQGQHHFSSELHVGATYWVLDADNSHSGVSFSITDQGYVTPSHEDIEFPSIAAEDQGGALMSFTLSGNGGPTGADDGGFYPSSAFGTLTSHSHGLVGNSIHIADLGKSPQDGFSEYQPYFGPGQPRPRWGDYGQAIFVPSMDGDGHDHGSGGVFFASEYIQSPNCSDSTFLTDPTCGGTRAPAANWGSSINFLSLP